MTILAGSGVRVIAMAKQIGHVNGAARTLIGPPPAAATLMQAGCWVKLLLGRAPLIEEPFECKEALKPQSVHFEAFHLSVQLMPA